jgi:ABC-2 type transport system permease protein
MIAVYRRVFGIGLQDTFVYRWNFVLRSLFSIIPLIGTVFVWRSVCEQGAGLAEYNLSAMVFYFVAVMVVDNLASPTEDEWRIATEIRDGQISALLIKPINHLIYRFSLFAAYRVLYSLVTLPVVGGILWLMRGHLQLPQHFWTWPLFALAVAGSALIQFFIAYSLAMLAFWILEVSTLIFILYSFEYFLSGHVFPLDLLSPKLQSALQWSPFPYELFFPVQILLERLDVASLQKGFGMQFLWVCILGTLARLLWLRGVRKYQAAGG